MVTTAIVIESLWIPKEITCGLSIIYLVSAVGIEPTTLWNRTHDPLIKSQILGYSTTANQRLAHPRKAPKYLRYLTVV